MRIENIRLEEVGNKPRVTALVKWENFSHPPAEIFFETQPDFADALACNGDPFLTAAAIPAFGRGEKRLLIDGEICPELKEGVTVVMNIFRYWYGLPQKPVEIEGEIRPGTMVAPRAG